MDAFIGSFQLEKERLDVRWKAVRCIVDEAPFVEVLAPVGLGTLKVCLDLRSGLGSSHLIGRIDLE